MSSNAPARGARTAIVVAGQVSSWPEARARLRARPPSRCARRGIPSHLRARPVRLRPKIRRSVARMVRMRGEMLKAMGDVMLKYGKMMEGVK